MTGDLEFLQLCYGEVIEAIGKALSRNTDCVLYGVKTTDDGGVSEGAVCIGGEILEVPSTLSSSVGRYLCFRLKDQEERVFADSQSHKIQRITEAYLSGTTDGSYKYLDLLNRKNLPDILSGDAFWKTNSYVTFPEGVTGSVENMYFGATEEGGPSKMRISIEKPASQDNLLAKLPATIRDTSAVGVTIDRYTYKVFSVTVVVGEMRVYNTDGSGYNGRVSIKNAILREL